jgi:hypothetical protein
MFSRITIVICAICKNLLVSFMFGNFTDSYAQSSAKMRVICGKLKKILSLNLLKLKK